MNLPSLFLNSIEQILGSEECREFAASYDSPSYRGLRLNPLKTQNDTKEALEKLPFSLTEIPWEKEGFYYSGDDAPGKYPLHEAGLYYIQEPSAMSAVPKLDIHPGEIVADLCASPGGKSTQIAGCLNGSGLLVSNEINRERAKNLSENIERMGVKNAIVLNEDTGRLKDRFFEFFDKILVDAPCSGEGMFRKNPDAILEWSPANVELCVSRQAEILDNAYSMLKTGGRLVFSTCTFNASEDEGSVNSFIERHPDMFLKETHRIWPHKDKGEGHFVAVLTKGIEKETFSSKKPCKMKFMQDKELTDYYSFLDEALKKPSDYKGNILSFGENIYLYPEGGFDLTGLKVMRPGLHLGTLKKNRFEPSHAFALALSPSEVRSVADFSATSDEISKYLRGESFEFSNAKGWTLIAADGCSIGWGKCSSGLMKNHYPKGLRR